MPIRKKVKKTVGPYAPMPGEDYASYRNRVAESNTSDPNAGYWNTKKGGDAMVTSYANQLARQQSRKDEKIARAAKKLKINIKPKKTVKKKNKK
jgi:hypothetical protein